MKLLTKINFILFIVCYILVGLLFIEMAKSDVIEVDNLALVYKNYLSAGSEPLVTNNGLPNRGLDKHLSFNLDMSVFSYTYIKTRVHSDTDYDTLTGGAGQFRSIGLEYELGLRLSRTIDLFLYHHSQHNIDTTPSFPFPVQDAVGIRINLIKSKRYDTLLE